MNFFKQVLATIIGLTIFQIISFIFFIIVIAAIVASSDSSANIVEVKDHSVLYVDLSYAISDKGHDEFSLGDLESLTKEKAGLQTLLEGIAHAKTDENIKGMYLDLSIMPNSYATVEALRASNT